MLPAKLLETLPEPTINVPLLPELVPNRMLPKVPPLLTVNVVFPLTLVVVNLQVRELIVVGAASVTELLREALFKSVAPSLIVEAYSEGARARTPTAGS